MFNKNNVTKTIIFLLVNKYILTTFDRLNLKKFNVFVLTKELQKKVQLNHSYK